MAKLKIKPKSKKPLSSQWEIIEDDIPMAQDGGYQWSTQKQPIRLATPNYATTKIEGRDKPLTEKEKQEFRKHTENLKLQQQQQELAARKARIEQSIQAQSQPFSAQNLAVETQAIGDKFRFFPNATSDTNLGMIDDYLNPFKMIGDMASGLGSVPYNVQEGNYGQAALAVGIPLGLGALAGVGAKTAGQFTNNLANPFAGAGDLVNNLGNKYLPNAYKLNPWSFKPNREAYYRTLGRDGFEDAISTGSLRARVGGDGKESILGINMSRPSDVPYFAKGEVGNYPGNDIIAETFKPLYKRGDTNPITGNQIKSRHWGYRNINQEGLADNLPIEDVNFYQKDWLKRYKKVPKLNTSVNNFKSEIDWSKWNKEIPENKALMQEYNAIEQTSKANGTWMKNPDGSPFQGTPEQFVQQNSENFKKAFGNSIVRDEKGDIIKMYHGSINKEPLTEYITPKRLKDFKRRTQTTKETDHTFFSPKKEIADKYSKRDLLGNDKGIIYENYINVKNPYFTNDYIDLATPHNLPNINSYDAVTNMKFGKDYSPKDYSELAIPFGNNVKSAIGNNGMFDMTNPNIYKSLIPIGSILGASQIQQKESGGKIKTDPQGYWNEDNHGKPVRIPSNRITMKGVNQPLLGISDTGDIQYMQPNGEYLFDGNSVLELPLMQQGGRTPIRGTREQYNSYLDSLNLYKAYQKQLKYNPPQDVNQSFIATHFKPSDKVYKENVYAKQNFKNSSPEQKLKWFKDNPTDYWHSEKQFKEEVPEDAPLIDFYRNLTFSTPTKTGLWTTPDLYNSTIAPIDIYFGGSRLSNAAWNPVFKKPVQPIIYEGDNSNSRSKPTIVGTNQKFKQPVQPIIPPSQQTERQNPLEQPQVPFPNTTNGQFNRTISKIRPKETPIKIESKGADLLPTNPINLELDPIPFAKGAYFTRERQPGEQGSALYDDKGKKYSLIDYNDKSGKKLGTFDPHKKKFLKNGGKTKSDWEIVS